MTTAEQGLPPILGNSVAPTEHDLPTPMQAFRRASVRVALDQATGIAQEAQETRGISWDSVVRQHRARNRRTIDQSGQPKV